MTFYEISFSYDMLANIFIENFPIIYKYFKMWKNGVLY